MIKIIYFIIFIIFNIKLCLCGHSGNKLYNITSDPYQSTSVNGLSKYTSLNSYFSERCTYWSTQTGETESPSSAYTTEKYVIYKEYGGVVPYITSDFVPRTVDQIYSYDAAPHIVFVLVDDWGYNDVGFRSTYLSWTTPTFDNLASEGVTLENYYTNQLCSPSRASLMTGRYALRTGIFENTGELSYNETTLAEEMKSAGYMTYLVGKWHLGLSTLQHTPTYRGFDYFYGYLSGEINYWSKASQYEDYMDLMENSTIVSNGDETSDKYHTAYLFADKAQAIIEKHATNYPDKPMFFYYALQLIHSYWSAPSTYQDRCEYPTTSDNDTNFELWNYCALNVMLDEVISNLTCVLKETGLSDNTILIISGDNGGNSDIEGNSYPFLGHKDTFFRGGISNTAIINSPLLPDAARGLKYYGQVHITDWLPTLMGLATDGAWTGSLNEAAIDGVDVWDAIVTNSESPKHEIVFTNDGTACAMQYDNVTYLNGVPSTASYTPEFSFTSDQDSDLSSLMCSYPSIMYSSSLHANIINLKNNAIKYMYSYTSYPVILLVASIAIIVNVLLWGSRVKESKLHNSAYDTFENDKIDSL